MASSLLDHLPKALLRRAVKGDTAEARALATQAIGRKVRTLTLSDPDRAFAGKLFDHISKDVCEEVRRALSVTLQHSPNLPRTVANRLIADIDSIAVPILVNSPVVTDDDLISILRSRAAAKVRAIAGRDRVSERVSGAVISFGDGPALAALAANDGALISQADAARLVGLAADDDLIREAALRRPDFPADLTAKLIDRTVDDAKGRLATRTPLSADIATHTLGRTTANFAKADWSSDALRHYVDALHARAELSQDVIARAAGQGDWRFVQLSLATLANVSVEKAGLMAFDPKPYGLLALAKRAGLNEPARMLLVASAAAFADAQRSSQTRTRRQFQRLMAERISTHPKADTYAELWLDWLDDALTLRVAS